MLSNSLSYSQNSSFFRHHSGQSSEGASGNGNDDGDGGDKKDDGTEVVIEDKSAGAKVDPSLGALAQVVVPDVFPEVPLLPVHRNPVFPRFVKMMEVCTMLKCLQ